MTYFTRVSHQTNPSNRLQTYIVDLIAKYNHLLTEDSEALFTLVEQLVAQAHRTYPRCSALKVYASRDHKSKVINNISVAGLITLNFYRIEGHYPKIKATQPAEPEPAPKPVLPEPPPTGQPRTAIYESREVDKIVRLEDWQRFAPRTQLLLKRGSVWKIYYDVTRNIVVEEFGGHLEPAF